jgi:hypothetical protein
MPVQIAAGLSEPMLDAAGNPRFDKDGRPLLRGKYNLHASEPQTPMTRV